jgi:DNA replication protein DnaC
VASQQLLAHIVRQFRLNSAQAAVAAHVADWLPQLLQDVQQRRQQVKGRGAVRPKTTALTADRAAAAVAPGGHAAGQGSASSSSSGGRTAGSSRPPVCLIHGPFGSGKSTLLVALIHLLTGLPAQQVSCTPGCKN